MQRKEDSRWPRSPPCESTAPSWTYGTLFSMSVMMFKLRDWQIRCVNEIMYEAITIPQALVYLRSDYLITCLGWFLAGAGLAQRWPLLHLCYLINEHQGICVCLCINKFNTIFSGYHVSVVQAIKSQTKHESQMRCIITFWIMSFFFFLRFQDFWTRKFHMCSSL